MTSRRDLLQALAMGGAGLLAGVSSGARAQHEGHDMSGMDMGDMKKPMPPAAGLVPPKALQRHPQGYLPVRTLNGWTLPYKLNGGVKEFHLVAEEIEHEFAPGCRAKCWGYNGTTPGPTIEAVDGDRVRIFVTNRLGEYTTVHWHGIDLPNGYDGVGGLNQPHIKPGETYVYEFTLKQHGTHMYHPHADEMTQMAFGMMGLFIIHPREVEDVPIDRDYAFLLHNWALHPGTYRPDPSVMQDFDLWTFNSKVFPAIDHLVARTGERIRIRIGNLSMWNHPIHLHSNPFWVTGSDGGRWPRAQWRREVTEIVGVGQMRDFEFEATEPGDWALHCHMAHHTMNAMGHGIPNPAGVDQSGVQDDIRKHLPGYMAMGRYGMSEHGEHLKMGVPGPVNTLPMMAGDGQFGPIEMGGMFTVVKVRNDLAAGDYRDPGWYQFPKGTVARRVSADPDFGSPPRRHPYGSTSPAPVMQPEMPAMDHSKHGG
ncbi:Tat (twin-arginine translocation) pathway signal sequence [Solimonas aquatica]|uniref:Tat (Twin-arginine translocation) pathway signal sequence n=1 Tax=Solimonas aquatica TaxID=489703 RepID=A0A1H9DWF4_9GAMM|nr:MULTISPECIES: copper oxidase [Solimonas]SEQ17819.1 Tat (twin-arginine translocation) pathway signal sequence [Solimonas aquatica]